MKRDPVSASVLNGSPSIGAQQVDSKGMKDYAQETGWKLLPKAGRGILAVYERPEDRLHQIHIPLTDDVLDADFLLQRAAEGIARWEHRTAEEVIRQIEEARPHSKNNHTQKQVKRPIKRDPQLDSPLYHAEFPGPEKLDPRQLEGYLRNHGWKYVTPLADGLVALYERPEDRMHQVALPLTHELRDFDFLMQRVVEALARWEKRSVADVLAKFLGTDA